MPGPKVSVVMAVYNSEKYLKKALASVFSQTLREIEIICVDDGSADASLSILEEAAKSEPRMKILRHTEPTDGAGAARNLGMAAATGTYLSTLNADDFFEITNSLESGTAKEKFTFGDFLDELKSIIDSSSFNEVLSIVNELKVINAEALVNVLNQSISR